MYKLDTACLLLLLIKTTTLITLLLINITIHTILSLNITHKLPLDLFSCIQLTISKDHNHFHNYERLSVIPIGCPDGTCCAWDTFYHFL